jgi:ribosomal RNA-processing protein 8
MHIPLYKHQKECVGSKKNLPKSLINIWCGGGKTRIIVYSIFDDNQEVNIIVFPSLGLINQFNNDYILCEDFMDYFKEYNCLSVCSDSESKLKIKTDLIRYTTNESIIKSYLKKVGKKLFTVTYQSLEMFMKIMVDNGTTINRLYYDEAHHILGHNIQNIVFKNDELNELIEKTEFYTATPDNKNGITMYDRENPENSDCGPIVYEYLFYQAVEDKISKDFTMKLMLYPKTEEDMFINLFKSIFIECFTGDYDYWNILTFHSMVEEKDDMATVNKLSKEENLFKKCFLEVIEEFPEMKSIYSVENVFLKGVGSKTRGREGIIEDFDKPEKGRIYLIASCKTLGEGIDTKYANMEIPINPGGSVVYEQQKLGRITRNPGKNNPNGIVLIPCWIDMEKYEGLDKYERDDMIRQELQEGGNFNTFLNVMSAYKNQCDPELWELCLKYPKMYSPKEIKDNLDKQGYKIDESKGDLIQNVNHIIGEDVSELVGKSDEETIQNIVSKGKQVEIHSQDKDLPIITYGSNTDEEPIRLFKDEEDVYHPVSKKEPSEPRRKIERPDKLRRNKSVNIHMNDEVKVLWKIDEDSFDNIDGVFCHGVLDAEIDYNEEKWFENLDKLKNYIDENKKKPSDWSKDKEIKVLGYWWCTQRGNYKKVLGIMKQSKIRKKWEDFIEKYSEYFKDNNELWYGKLNELEEYININNKKPSNESSDDKTKILGSWIYTNTQNYKKKSFIMSDPLIRKKWEDFIEKYSEYFKDKNKLWYEKLNELEEYIIENERTPSNGSKDKLVKSIGTWFTNQKVAYQNVLGIMKDPKIKESWEDFMEKYNEYFKDNNEIWYEKLNKVKDYIKGNNIIPAQHSKDEEIEKLGTWLCTQKSGYKNECWIMKDPKIKESWEEFMEKYSEYFKDNNEIWNEKLNKVKGYIKDNNILPSQYSKDEEIQKLGKWIAHQKANYNKKEYTMRNHWKQFIEEYKNYFEGNNRFCKWYKTLSELEQYIIENNKLPYESSDDKKIKALCNWVNNQKQNYKKTIKLMQENKIRESWENFNDKYSKAFSASKGITKDKQETIWNNSLQKVKQYIIDHNILPPKSTDKDINYLCNWVGDQKKYYKNGKMKKEYIKPWENFIKEYSEYFKDNNEIWYKNLNQVEEYIKSNKKLPNKRDKNKEIKVLGSWLSTQKTNYQKEKDIMKEVEIRKPWEDFTKEYSEYFTTTKPKKDMSKKEIKPMVKKETTEQKQERFKSEISILHQKYKTMNSQTLHKHFEDNPDDWLSYHKISEENEESFPDEEIPYKKIIEYLENIPGKKTKDVADLGCGKARVCEHFSESERFKFINMDHVSCNDIVVKHDIKDTGLDDYSMDIVVLSLAMWGSNCRDYITEANRILDENGVLLIIEATKRWTNEETQENKLVRLLEDNNFTIKNIEEEKFMFIECIKT